MGQRPLSPHLTVYRPLIGAFTSILHRATGALLLAGTVVLALWVLSIAVGGSSYDCIDSVLSAWYGQLALFGWTFAGYYYISQWVRHFFWDLGYGFELPVARFTGWLVVGVAVAMTLLTWSCVIVRSGS